MNAVTRLGNEIVIVRKVCTIFQLAGIPGSWNWWCSPTGVEITRKYANTIRPSGSEKR